MQPGREMCLRRDVPMHSLCLQDTGVQRGLAFQQGELTPTCCRLQVSHVT
jgi:hypothetical protein